MHDESAPPTPLVHIGLPKALSSWLQQRYFLNNFGYQHVLDAFKLQVLLVTPDEATFDKDGSREQIFQAIEAAHRRGLHPVISSEALCGDLVRGGHNTVRNADRLQSVLGGEGKILLIVREQRQLIRSAYKTLVFFGEERKIKSLLRPSVDGEPPRFNTDFLQFDRIVELYQERFSPSSVLVLPYEMFCQQPELFLDKVNKHAGLDLADDAYGQLPLQQRLNANEPLGFIAGQRLLNRLKGTASDDFSGRAGCNSFEHILKRIAWHKRNARPSFVDRRLEQRFSDSVQGLTEGVFSASNQRLRQQTGLDLGAYGYQ